MTQKPTVHIIGAGLAGLAAAVQLAGGERNVIVYEAARQAGGRCRSYFDTTLGMVIDNGNHLLLSGNADALDFLRLIGGLGALSEAPEADVAFIDLASKERWRVRPNAGPLPWWIFAPDRRVPGARWSDYLALLPLLAPGADRRIDAIIDCKGLLYDRLWRPFSRRPEHRADGRLRAARRRDHPRDFRARRRRRAGRSSRTASPPPSSSPRSPPWSNAAPMSASITGCAKSPSATAARARSTSATQGSFLALATR